MIFKLFVKKGAYEYFNRDFNSSLCSLEGEELKKSWNLRCQKRCKIHEILCCSLLRKDDKKIWTLFMIFGLQESLTGVEIFCAKRSKKDKKPFLALWTQKRIQFFQTFLSSFGQKELQKIYTLFKIFFLFFWGQRAQDVPSGSRLQGPLLLQLIHQRQQHV